MSDDSDGEEVLDNIVRDLEEAQALLERVERVEIITEQATNRLKLYRERYHDDSHPMPPDESDFHGGNKDFTEDREE